MASPIEIIADDREQAAPVIEHLQSIANVVVTVTRLRLGDYLVDQKLLFERKSQVDLPASITTKLSVCKPTDRVMGAPLAAYFLRPCVEV